MDKNKQIADIKLIAVLGNDNEHFVALTPAHKNIIGALISMQPAAGAQISQETVEEIRAKDLSKIVTPQTSGIIKKL